MTVSSSIPFVDSAGIKPPDPRTPRKGHPALVEAMHGWLRNPPYGEFLRVLALFHCTQDGNNFNRGEQLKVWDLVEGPKRDEHTLIAEIMDRAANHAKGLRGEQIFLVDAFFGEGGGNKQICIFPVHERPNGSVERAGTERSERVQGQFLVADLAEKLLTGLDRVATREAAIAARHETQLNRAYARIEKLEDRMDTAMAKRLIAVDAIETMKDRTEERKENERDRESRRKIREKLFDHFQVLLPILVSKFRLGGGTPQALPAPYAAPMLAAAPVPAPAGVTAHAAPPPVQTAPPQPQTYAPPPDPVGPSAFASLSPNVVPIECLEVTTAPGAPPTYAPVPMQPPAPPAPTAAPPAPASAPASAQPTPPAQPTVHDLNSAILHLRSLIVAADESLAGVLLPVFATLSMPQQAFVGHFVQQCKTPEGPGPAEMVGFARFFESLDDAQSEKFMGALKASAPEFYHAIANIAFYSLPAEERAEIERRQREGS